MNNKWVHSAAPVPRSRRFRGLPVGETPPPPPPTRAEIASGYLNAARAKARSFLAPPPLEPLVRLDPFSAALTVLFVSLFLSLSAIFAVLTRAHGLAPVAELRAFPEHARVTLSSSEGAREVRRGKTPPPPVKDLLASQVRRVLHSAGAKRGGDYLTNLAEVIVTESVKANYDPLFITAVIKHESTFNRNAVSHKGALGLMQILPSTGEYVARVHKLPWQGPRRLSEARYNVRLGISYMKHLERLFGGNWEHVLIAYNWGPTNLLQALKKGRRVPASPVRYARSIIRTHLKWRSDAPFQTA